MGRVLYPSFGKKELRDSLDDLSPLAQFEAAAKKQEREGDSDQSVLFGLADEISLKARFTEAGNAEDIILAQKWSQVMTQIILTSWDDASDSQFSRKRAGEILSETWTAVFRTHVGSRVRLAAEQTQVNFMNGLSQKKPLMAFHLNYAALRLIETSGQASGISEVDAEHILAFGNFLESWESLREVSPAKALLGTWPLFRRLAYMPDRGAHLFESWEALAEDLSRAGHKKIVADHIFRVLKEKTFSKKVHEKVSALYVKWQPTGETRRLRLVKSARPKGPYAPKTTP